MFVRCNECVSRFPPCSSILPDQALVGRKAACKVERIHTSPYTLEGVSEGMVSPLRAIQGESIGELPAITLSRWLGSRSGHWFYRRIFGAEEVGRNHKPRVQLESSTGSGSQAPPTVKQLLLEGVVGKPVGVRVPPSAPDEIRRSPEKSVGSFFRFIWCSMGTRTGEGRRADSEEKGDVREPVSQEPRRQGRWPGWPRLRRSSPPFGTIRNQKGNPDYRRVPFFR